MEARPPAENRHGGAPRGARPSGFEGRGAPRKRPGTPRYISAFTRVLCIAACQPVPRKHRVLVGAPPTPHGVDCDKTRTQTRRGNEMFCVGWAV